MIAGLAVAGNADLVLSGGIIVLGMLVAAAGGGTVLPDPGGVVVAALKVAGVVAVVVAVLVPTFRGSAARAVGLITGAYLLPLTVAGLVRAIGVEPSAGFEAVPASPVQVAVVLVGVAAVAAVGGLAGPAARPFGTSLVIRLAVVPVVAVHAGLLLPAAWSGLGRFVIVAGVLIALLFLLPQPAASPDARAADLLSASGLAVLALAVYPLALPGFVGDPAIVVLGLFWLSVAVIAAGVIRTVADDDPAPRSTPQPDPGFIG